MTYSAKLNKHIFVRTMLAQNKLDIKYYDIVTKEPYGYFNKGKLLARCEDKDVAQRLASLLNKYGMTDDVNT